MGKVVIFGIGNFAKIIHYYFTEIAKIEVVGFTLDKKDIKDDNFLNLPIIDFKNVKNVFPNQNHLIHIGVGYKKLNRIRQTKYLEAKNMGYKFANFIHPSSIIAKNVKIGDNVLILENNIIQPFAKIGNNTIIWCNNAIGHDVEINDNCFISSSNTIGGYTKIGNNSFLGLNVAIKNNVSVGKFNIIGVSATILENTQDYAVYVNKQNDKQTIDSKIFEKLLV